MYMTQHTAKEYIEASIVKNALILETSNITDLLSKKDEVCEDYWNDYMNDFRCNGSFSGLPSKNSSRHYEVDFVYALVFDRVIGWDYWHGGGKHGEPSAMDWLSSAEFLAITATEMVPKYTFKREDGYV